MQVAMKESEIKLSEPLLDLEDSEVSFDDEHDDVAFTCTIQIGSDGEEMDETSVTCGDTTVLLCLFPVLLMAQFGMVFAGPVIDTTLSVSWSTVNYVIVLFAITSWLYRHTLADLKITNLFLLVVPEIMLNIVLGLVVWNNAAVAFCGLLLGLFALGLFIAVCSAQTLIMDYMGKNDEETEVDEQVNQYEAVTY